MECLSFTHFYFVSAYNTPEKGGRFQNSSIPFFYYTSEKDAIRGHRLGVSAIAAMKGFFNGMSFSGRNAGGLTFAQKKEKTLETLRVSKVWWRLLDSNQ